MAVQRGNSACCTRYNGPCKLWQVKEITDGNQPDVLSMCIGGSISIIYGGGSILASLSNLLLSLLYFFVICLSCRFNFVCHVAVRNLFFLFSLFILIFTITLILSKNK